MTQYITKEFIAKLDTSHLSPTKDIKAISVKLPNSERITVEIIQSLPKCLK
jgi:hypothetical protein